MVVDELLGLGVGAAAFQAEEVVAARDVFAVAGFQCPLGTDEFGVFSASVFGGLGDAFPGDGVLGMFAGGTPGFEPVLFAAE